MLGVTLRLARGTAGRLAAAGAAVALGAAFVAAVLLATGLLRQTTYDQVASGYAGADVVVEVPQEAPLGAGAVEDLGALEGARGAVGVPGDVVVLVAAGRTAYPSLAPTTPTEPFASLPSATPSSGELPAGPGEVALSLDVAQALDVGLGQQVTARTYPADAGDAGSDAGPTDTDVTVVALLPRAGSLGGGAALVAPEQARAWAYPDAPGTALTSTQVLVAAADGTSPEALRARVAAAVPGAVSVETADVAAQAAVDDLTDGQDVLTGVLLAFAVLALFVAGVVIANTFAVLVAQRTRQLALLRCVGATAAQVRRGVLVEAAVLGLAASAVGTAVGTALAAGAAAVLARTTDGTVAGTVTVTAASVVLPLVLGTVATVLAALAPARAATRVAPLAALRPTAPSASSVVRSRGSRPRLVLAALLVVVGLAALVAGSWLSGSGAALLLAMAGGALSFTGVLVGAVFVVPAVVGAVGGLLARGGGAAARLSVANAVRNPRRTATTTSALLIGVTLVSLVVVGAASTQRTLSASLDEVFSVDTEVGSGRGAPVPVGDGPDGGLGRPVTLPTGVADAVAGAEGVAATAGLREATATTDGPDGPLAVAVRGVEPERAREVLLAPDQVAPLARGTAVVPDVVAPEMGVRDGQEIVLTDGDRSLALTAAVTSLRSGAVLVAADDLDALDPGAPVTAVWARFAPGADATTTLEAVRTAVAGQSSPGVAGASEGTAPGAPGVSQDAVPVTGAAVERAAYEQVITVLLRVVVGLLAAAVVIAVVGVANTLSLSVLERTAESALLRALGLTRGQLRSMLALEGALIAGVGALVGVVLGVGYGWAGARALLGGVGGPVLLDVPWGSLAAVLVVAVLAGLGASVLPGRRAARTPPVAALGE